VTGTLRLEPESRVSFGPRDLKVEQYFYIDAAPVQVIEQTSDPVLAAPDLK
jgi:hypothetical protein